ncbi:MAG: hypothetical protein IKP17_09685 [Oscillospiraceae bacterium]|nr:hypothetical protein [Oscillospiraceae bacterium]MBR4693014.1 hypothetical protein [Oscillospiraceae bacterium]
MGITIGFGIDGREGRGLDWEKLYHLLFNRITDALEQLERRNYGSAEELLRKAQLEAEECYLGSREGEAEQ